jgi:hypothetical protein
MKKNKVDLVKQAAITRQDVARMEQMSQAMGSSNRKRPEVNHPGARAARRAAKEI